MRTSKHEQYVLVKYILLIIPITKQSTFSESALLLHSPYNLTSADCIPFQLEVSSSATMPGLVRGTVRYNVPDTDVRPEDRGLFSGPAHSYGEDVEVDLYDPETSSDIVQGPEGLDVQGFTYVKHKSALDEDAWMVGQNVEDIYVQEVMDLVKKATGAKHVVVNHLGIRKRLSNNNNDPKFYRKAGDKHDETVKDLTRQDRPWGE